MRGRAARLTAITFSAAILLAACGNSGGSGSTGGSGGAYGSGGGAGNAGGSTGGGGEDMAITIQNFAFHPTTLTVPSGTSVTIEITNDDSGVEHSFTLNDDSVSQDIEGGEDAKVTLDLTKSIGWHCEYHPQTMKGTITVT
jgi:plastocyanin